MMRISNTTQSIIDKLGYTNSKNLLYITEIHNCKELSFHDRKVLIELNPCAFFVVEGKPKVLFFDYIAENDKSQKLIKKIWNAQVPVIIFSDYDSIKVFNGNSLDLAEIDNLKLNQLYEQDISECNELSPFSYWNITSEKFLREYQIDFSKETLNEVMIRNISCITEKLKNKFNVHFATKLILRIIFIRFLIDRGVDIGYKGFKGLVEEDQNLLLEISKDKGSLYELFVYLKKKFNGNLFELGTELDENILNNEVFCLLQSFLSGKEEMESGQLSFLPLYDFNIIPIELISNIYEILLGTEAQQNDKAFYTPEYLADYVVKETVGTFLSTQKKCKVLDPACGSGIFLVQSLKQIIGKNVDEDGFINDNNKLIALVEENIFGVDLNPEAIDITIFSLYLTLFDYKDPKSLEGFKLPNLLDRNLFISDFFDDNRLKELKNISIDFIIGNPPWGSIKKGLHIEYCREHGIDVQRYEISRSFIAKVKDYAVENTICALIVPSKLFYNQQKPAIKFRKQLLESCEILKFVEMSSVRKILFKKADAPAAIIFYRFSSEECLNHSMVHISLKPNMFFRLYHVIATEKIDIKKIQQRVLFINDWAWKTCVYGTNWDIDNVRMLKRKFPTLKDIFKENGLKTTAGISDNEGEFDATCYKGRKVIESTAIDAFYYDKNQKSDFDKDKIYRLGKPEVYYPPYCLMRKGTNCKNYRLRAAFVEDDVIFKQAISAIKGNENQKELLYNISGIINSSMYAYLNLMLGSSVGIEREQVFMDEIYQFPFVYDSNIGDLSKQIQEKKSSIEDVFIPDMSAYERELDDKVLNDFGLNEDPFIDYALNVQIPMVNSSRWEYSEVSIEQLKEYANVFQKYWKPLMEQQDKHIAITLYPKIVNKYTVFEMNILDSKSNEEIIIQRNADSNKELLSRFMIGKINDQFYQIRDVLYFGNTSFFIIKSNEAKNWHPAIGYIDNTAVVDSILSDGKGES